MDETTRPTDDVDAGRGPAVVDLPGPRAWPLVGHLLHFDLPRIHLQMEDWARTYGPMYRLRFLRTEVLVLSDVDGIAEVLRSRPATWRRMHNIEQVAREAGLHGLVSAEGSDWMRQRRLVMRAFDPVHLRHFRPRLATVTERLKQRWLRAARDGEVLDLQPQLMRYAVDAVVGLAFGVDSNTIEQQRSELNEHLQTVLPILNRRLHAPFPYWRYVRLRTDRDFERHLKAVRAMLRGLIAATAEQLARDDGLRAAPRNLLQALLVARDDADGETASPAALTEDEVMGNLFTVLLAGQETTANTLAWTIYLLRQHPAAWRRLREEVDRSAQQGLLPADSDTAEALPYTDACVDEAMRLHPVAPLFYLEACRDTRLKGIRVPQGTYLFCLTRMGATDEARVPHANEYLPQRWLEPEGASSLKRLSIPFGAGPRVCPGRHLARLEMRLVLAMLARDFELADVSTATGRPPAERMDFTVHPEGLRMRVVARQPECEVSSRRAA